mmetsp:Transcript_4613/g.6897  ORF Transcript_4613/g.6897 Transcript_4613/m.6897 type:complete len:420 (+) Transcript_4613:157-1416(+)|eukprot:CAMPEP_0203750618 /NCGR_PEP_ID=MMETSP0098-20131031/4831_1 /ASSEMBLY_ACC=CAM_ASM_000208 /TAXON_ID=96639 /ORGANISM=" , Strain NY0313808BC1" /LENGTH=419 /DNA_ID=CAMNT_0050640007 /DNA_START=121 /DNA_END=1380 /DNA_ORIENTATION=+
MAKRFSQYGLTAAAIGVTTLTGLWWAKPLFERRGAQTREQQQVEKKVASAEAEETKVQPEETKSNPQRRSKVVGRKPLEREYGDNISWFEAFHELSYPADSKYYWYREGLIHHSYWKEKYINTLLYLVFTGIAGSGVMMGLVLYGLSLFMMFVDEFVECNGTCSSDGFMHLVHEWWFCLMMCFISSTITVCAYYHGASHLENEYNVKRKGKEAEWKCQPNRILSEKLHAEEVFWGCFNATLAGFLGMGLFMLHLNYPFLKFYYDLDRGWLHFFRGFLIVFFWIEAWAYTAHRFLHKKFIYKYIHKWHHRYIAPSAFSAFGMHPFEFLLFQSGGIACCVLFDIHIMAFFAVVTYVSAHGQIDHSDVWMEGEFPWQPSAKYHSDHHSCFHVNYGQNIVLFDWLFGTLRQKQKTYTEETFHG